MSNNTTKKGNGIESIARGSLATRAAEVITQSILNKTFALGDYLPSEEVLSKELGIGRSSVREAIKSLESKGLIKKLHGKGMVVINESIAAASELIQLVIAQRESTLHDVVEFRNSLEIKIAKIASQRATEEDLAVILDSLNKMRREINHAERYAIADYNFHLAIAKATKNSIFIMMLEMLRPTLLVQMNYTLTVDANPESSIKYHEKIYDAIVSRNHFDSGEAMRAHLYGTKEIINRH